MIKEYEIKPIQQILICDECSAIMNCTGVVVPESTPLYRYECNNCYKSLDVREKYPKIKYEIIKEVINDDYLECLNETTKSN